MTSQAAPHALAGRRRRLLTAAIFGLITAAFAHAQTAPEPAASGAAGIGAPAADPMALVDEGRRRYVGLCARCHGLNLVTNGIGFDLRAFPPGDKERFLRSVRGGLRAMPSFENVVRPADLEAIWAYLGSVNGWPR